MDGESGVEAAGEFGSVTIEDTPLSEMRLGLMTGASSFMNLVHIAGTNNPAARPVTQATDTVLSHVRFTKGNR